MAERFDGSATLRSPARVRCVRQRHDLTSEWLSRRGLSMKQRLDNPAP
jgi:hypothetical protein